MRLPEMRNQVRSELSHIADWPKPQQSELRMLYWARRMNSLGKKAEKEASALDVLRECIKELKERFPDHECLYDKTFFKKLDQ